MLASTFDAPSVLVLALAIVIGTSRFNDSIHWLFHSRYEISAHILSALVAVPPLTAVLITDTLIPITRQYRPLSRHALASYTLGEVTS